MRFTRMRSFTDEFGEIDRDVYAAADALWPQAERYALQTIRDAAAGQRLLMKACALITRRRNEMAGEIANLRTGALSPLTIAVLRSELEARRTTTPVAADVSGNVAVR